LAALRKDTDDEASSAAAAQVTLHNAVKPDDEAKVGANWQSRRDGPTRKEAGRVTKRKSHHPGGPSPQVLTANEDDNVTANWQTKERGHPREEASWATKQKANPVAHQGSGMRSPQVLTASFGSTAGTNQGRTGQRESAANFFLAPRKAGDAEAWVQAEKAHKEATHAAAQRKTNHSANQGGGTRSPQATALFGSTVENFQGKTGQRGSAANFFPAPRKGRRAESFLLATGTPYKKEATAQGTRVPSHRVSVAASAGPRKDEYPPNNAGMAKLGQNMLVPGTTAAQLAEWVRKEKAEPGWEGNGACYRACLEAITRAPDPLATALGTEAAGKIYLAMVNGDGSFLVLHNLARFEEPAGMKSRAGGHIVAFEGEIRDDFSLPRLLQFEEPDNELFALDSFPIPALHDAAIFYHRDGENDFRFHNKVVPSPPRGQRYCHLIPVPTKWAPWFLNNPDLGTTFRRLIILMQEAEQDDREQLQHFAASITYACGSLDPRANHPISALSSKWQWVTYFKATLHWAMAQWEGHTVPKDTGA
jgi:hypothetical protein